MAAACRTLRFDRGPANGRNRRSLAIRARTGHRLDQRIGKLALPRLSREEGRSFFREADAAQPLVQRATFQFQLLGAGVPRL
jgi:hypothetical protein